MSKCLLLFSAMSFISCTNHSQTTTSVQQRKIGEALQLQVKKITDTTGWAYFLQHLPEENAPILNYKGQPISYQEKHAAIIPYDIGTKDLQQCADALMRLRAEYLFSQKRSNEIGFHFTIGQLYKFSDYCNGLRPVPKGESVRFIHTTPCKPLHQNLRKYLDIVYNYAGTISLAKELRPTNNFGIGTIIIHPGSPGHCFIITNEATTASGEKLFKLVEGYTPAQSIYVLKNTNDASLGVWHRLSKGTITTASYEFSSYQLKKFE